MRLSYYRVFLSILDTGSFAKAAQREHLTQPAVTSAIHALEEELGCQLLVRTSGQHTRIVPTPAGECFEKYAKKALQDYWKMKSELVSLQENLKPLNLIFSPTLASTIAPILVDQFQKTNPSIPIKYVITEYLDIASDILRSPQTICLSGSVPKHSGLVSESFYYDPLILIAPASMGLKRTISKKELEKLPLIIRPEHSANITKVIKRTMEREGIDFDSLNVVIEVGANTDVLQAVILGTGVGFITQSLYDLNKTNKVIMKIDVKGLTIDRNLYLTRNKAYPFTQEKKLFWEYALSTDWHSYAKKLEQNE